MLIINVTGRMYLMSRNSASKGIMIKPSPKPVMPLIKKASKIIKLINRINSIDMINKEDMIINIFFENF